MNFPILSVAVVLLLLLGGWGVGHAIGRRAMLLAPDDGANASHTIWLLVGLGVIGQVAFIGGAIGPVYTRAVFWPAMAMCGLVGVWELRGFAGTLTWPTWWARGNGGVIISTVTLIVCGFSLWNATGFATGSDVLSHYYPHVQHMLTIHRFGYDVQMPYGIDHTSNYNPGLAEQLFVICQLLADERASNLFSAITSILIVTGLYGLGKAVDSPRTGWLAIGVYLGAGFLSYFPWEPQDYTLTAAFLLATIEALFRYRKTHSVRWLVVAGVLGGLMASTKYYGFVAIAPLAILALFAGPRERRLWAGLGFGIVAAAVVSPWLAYNLWHFGNPLFPAFSDAEYPRLHAIYYPVATLATFVLPTIGSTFTAKSLYWLSMFVPIAAGYASFGLSPVFLLALPVSTYDLWRSRKDVRDDHVLFLLSVALFGVLHILFSGSAFYKWSMFPGVVYAVSIAMALNRWRGWERRIGWTLVTVVAAFNLWLNVRPTARYYFPVRSAQVERWDPVARELNAKLDDGMGVAGIGLATGYYLRPAIRKLVTENNELATSWARELTLIREAHIDLLLTPPGERREAEKFYTGLLRTAGILDPSGRKSLEIAMIRDQVMTRTANKEQFIAACTTPFLSLPDGSALVRIKRNCQAQ